MAKPSNEHERVLRRMLLDIDIVLSSRESSAIKWALDDIIGKLPLTADGVRVVPGDVLFRGVHESKPATLSVRTPDPCAWGGGDGYMRTPVGYCYSTREAAERARKESGDE